MSAEEAVQEAPGGPAPEPVRITVCPDGPLLVRGSYELLDGDGRPVDPGRATVALCRCGASSVKPFCDGSHKRARFRAR
ncbi:MAG: CDGSH iron-sulfur domain-containing protein [Actinomycetota bacterium]